MTHGLYKSWKRVAIVGTYSVNGNADNTEDADFRGQNRFLVRMIAATLGKIRVNLRGLCRRASIVANG